MTINETSANLEALLREAKDNLWHHGREGHKIQEHYWRGYEHAIYSVINPDMMQECRSRLNVCKDAEGRAEIRGWNDGLKAAGYTS